MRLRFLILPTCVGFRYGQHMPGLRKYFPASDPARSGCLSAASLTARLRMRISLHPSAPCRSDGDFRHPAGLRPTRPSLETCAGGGFLTAFPSATPLGLALGAGLPRADCPCAGNLRFSADGDPTRLFVTYACILSSAPSSAPRRYAFPGQRNAPLPVTPQGVNPWLRYHA